MTNICGDVMKWLVSIFGCIAFGMDLTLNVDQQAVCTYKGYVTSFSSNLWQIYFLFSS